jgi:tetratricopeptide (TPR) repeat protein
METLLLRSLSGDPARDEPIFREIIQVDTELLQIDPFVPFPRKNLASAYYNLGQRDEAFKQVETAINCEPNYVPGYMQLAAWYKERGDISSTDRYNAAAAMIANKYRDFKPTEAYEAVLLGRPSGPSR